MSGSNFDLLVQEVIKQQNTMEELEKENRELRRQLADLRTGRGIFIKICGKSFILGDKATDSAPSIAAAAAETQLADEARPKKIEAPVPSVEAPAAELATVTEAAEPSEVVAEESVEQYAEVVVDAPTAQVAEHKPEAIAAAAHAARDQAAGSATFLEEIMIDEFATASTKPMAVWDGPVNATRKREDIDEEQKARLRRELTGSFLLE